MDSEAENQGGQQRADDDDLPYRPLVRDELRDAHEGLDAGRGLERSHTGGKLCRGNECPDCASTPGGACGWHLHGGLQRAFCCRHRAAASSSAQELGSKSKKQGTNRLDRGDDGDDTTAAILDTTVLWRFRRAEADVKQHERVKRYHRVRLMAALALACGAAAIAAAAQPDPMTDLASRSSIVVLGTVVRVGASEEPLLPATNATAVIKIEKMLAGADLVGDQSGGTATVILKAPQTI